MSFPTVALAEIAQPVTRPVSVLPGISYRTIGVKWWGEGAYERETIDGSQTAAKMLSFVCEGDLIINKIWVRHGSTAIASKAVDGCAASGEFPTFELDRAKVLPRWIHWLTKSHDFWSKCDALSHGTSGKNRIRPELFLTIQIPLPPLSEQNGIVKRIEELAAKIEEVKGLRWDAVDEIELVAIAERSEIFEKDLKGVVSNLNNVASLERGKFAHRPRNDPRFFGGDHPWIQIAEIESSGKYIQKWTQTLNDEGLSISRKFPKGTLLVSIAATIGAVGILDFDCCIPDSIVAVTPKQGIDAEYLYHYFGYVRSNLEKIAPQSAQKNINLEILYSLPIPVLPIVQQRGIASHLDELQTKIDRLKQLQSETSDELDALLPSILDKAFKGEL